MNYLYKLYKFRNNSLDFQDKSYLNKKNFLAVASSFIKHFMSVPQISLVLPRCNSFQIVVKLGRMRDDVTL